MTEKLYGNFEDVGEELIGVLSAPDVIYEANYNLLFNRPKINGVELEGDKSWDDLGLDLTPYAKIEDVYSKDESDGKFALKSEIPDDFYSKAETDELISEVEEKIPTDFYTKSETDEKIGAVEMTAVQALNTGSYANQRIDGLGDTYYTKAAAESFNRSISASIVDLYDKIPTNLSQLTPDATHRTVTDEQIADWNAKSEFDGDYNSLANKPTIPSKVAELSDASEYAKKSEIPTDYATQDDIDTALNTPMSDVETVEGVGYDVAVSGNSAKIELVGGRTIKQARMKSVDLGTLSWAYNGGIFTTRILDSKAMPNNNTLANLICKKYTVDTFTNISKKTSDKTIGFGVSNYLAVNDIDFSDAASFKSAMSGVMLTYESTEDELVSAKVDRVNDYPIPTAIQQLDGYGLSVSDEIYNYIDFERKKFVKRVASVDLGDLSWEKFNAVFYATIATADNTSTNIKCKCGKYIEVASVKSGGDADVILKSGEVTMSYGTSRPYVYVKDDNYTNATSFKSAMQGVQLIYELATPEEIDISAYLTDDVYIKADGSVIYHSDSGLDVPYRMECGVMSRLWETALDKGGSAPAPSGGGMELLFEGVTSQASPADLSNIEDYHAVLISIGKPPISNTITYFGSNVYLVSDLLMFSLTNPKRFNTYVWGSSVDCVITQDKKVYSESSTYNYLVVYGIK